MVEDVENRCKISIWWDIENCHVPKDVDPHYVAQNLSSALQRAGLYGPIEIQAFGDTTILPHVTQKALSDTGITLNHVPRGNKDAADKAILVGMLLWALDNPAPANILLISGDGDFANALHRLRLKTYSILLARPSQFVKPALMGAAKKRWFWKDMAKGQLAEADLPLLNGDSSEGPACVNGALDKYKASSNGISNPGQYSSLPNGFTSPQKRVDVSHVENSTHMLRSLSLENQPKSLSVSTPSFTERKSSTFPDVGPVEENKLSTTDINAHQSMTPNSVSHNMGPGQYPYILPRAAECQQSSKSTRSIPGITANPSKTPQFPPTPAVPMPNWPGTHITPNNGGNNVTYPKSSVPHKYSIPTVNIPTPSSQHTAPNRGSSSSEKMSYDTCLDKVYSAMKTLERDMLLPTGSNLYDCIQYWDPQHERIDLKLTLNRAAQLRQVTKTRLGPHLVMYFPPEQPVPWTCVDPGNMQLRHSNDVWLELQCFLLYGEKRQAFLAARSWYDAGQIVKSSSGEHIKNLVMGQVLNLLQQAMQEKKWFRKNGPGMAPFVLNLKAVLDFAGGEMQKGGLIRSANQVNSTDIVKSTNQANTSSVWKPVQSADVWTMVLKDEVLNKLRACLVEFISTKTGYDLSMLSVEFERATGMPLDCQKLGFSNLQDLLKELRDVVFIETTSNGKQLLHLLKQPDGGELRTSSLNNGDDVASRQIVCELKSWLIQLMTVVRDGYDISRVQQDFLQATGKDLNKEGVDSSNLQCILKQFPDVIQIVQRSSGSWVAYPAGHNVGDINGNWTASVM